MTLMEITPNTEVRVVRLKGTGALRQRLLDMGFSRGARVRVVRYAPLRDPIQIQVCGSNLALRKRDAELIEVEVVES